MNRAFADPLEFGHREPGVDYALRPGGYAVVLRAGTLAMLETPAGRLLPGGGCESGETAERAAIREALEECGLRIALRATLGTADELVFSRSEQRHFRKRGTFFLAEVLAYDGPGEPDHCLLWRPWDEVARLRHGSHRWAVERALARIADPR